MEFQPWVLTTITKPKTIHSTVRKSTNPDQSAVTIVTFAFLQKGSARVGGPASGKRSHRQGKLDWSQTSFQGYRCHRTAPLYGNEHRWRHEKRLFCLPAADLDRFCAINSGAGSDRRGFKLCVIGLMDAGDRLFRLERLKLSIWIHFMGGTSLIVMLFVTRKITKSNISDVHVEDCSERIKYFTNLPHTNLLFIKQWQ